MAKNRNKFKNIKNSATEKWAIAFLTLSIITLIVGALPFLSMIAVAFYYLIIVLIMVLTLFLILLNKDFVSKLSAGGDFMNSMVELIKYSPYVFAGASALAVVSVILFATGKSIDSKGVKITASVIFAVLPLVLTVLLLLKS